MNTDHNTKVKQQPLSIEERLDRVVLIVEELASDAGVSDLSEKARGMLTELFVDRINRKINKLKIKILNEGIEGPRGTASKLKSIIPEEGSDQSPRSYTRNKHGSTTSTLEKQYPLEEKFYHPGISDSGGSLEDFIDKSSEL